MAKMRAFGAVVASAALVLGPGCAEVISRSTVQIEPRSDAEPLVLGPPGGEITARGLAAAWTQDGDRLAVRLTESRTCESVRHVPVVRIERVHRKTAGGAMWFEYGLGAGALAVGLAGLIKPEVFSQGSATIDGETVQDKSAGYRIGGIFTGLGVILLTAAVIDTVRTRDEVIYTDAYRRERGGTIECRDPLVPLQAHTIELLVDEWSTVEPTDDEGSVRFLLPPVDRLPPKAREAIEATAQWEAARQAAEAEAARRAEQARQQAEAEAEAAKGKRGRKRRGGRKVEEPPPPEEPPPDPLAALGPRPEPYLVKGVVRVDRARALAVDFLVPYEGDAARAHAGEGTVEPVPSVDPPPRAKAKAKAKAKGKGTETGAAAGGRASERAEGGDPGVREEPAEDETEGAAKGVTSEPTEEKGNGTEEGAEGGDDPAKRSSARGST